MHDHALVTSKLQLYQGDCLERMKEIPDGSVDLILTDPPYVKMVSEKWDNISDEEANYFYGCVFFGFILFLSTSK
jgi:DNA modification methylase